MAVSRNEPDRLKRVAKAWWDAAETDQQARNALADRIDGKAVQPISNDGEDPFMFAIARVERKVIDDNATDTNS